MNSGFITPLLLICQFELKRLFVTKKGLLYLITFAVVWYFILLYPIRFASDLVGQGQNYSQSNGFFQFLGISSLLNWQVPELGVYWRLALIMFPLLCVMITADQTCSDRDRGTLRFLTLRLNRSSLFFGRFAGAMVIQGFLIVTTLFTTWLLAIYRDGSLFSVAFSSAIAIAINLLLVLLPFTAMMAALSAALSSARQATVWAILIWSFMAGIISGLSYYLPVVDVLKILIPGYQMAELAQLSEWQALNLAYIPLLQTIVLLFIGRWIMLRQSL